MKVAIYARYSSDKWTVVQEFTTAAISPIRGFLDRYTGRKRSCGDGKHRKTFFQLHFKIRKTQLDELSETNDRQKARTACNIGTQPVIPAVYGVKAPL